MNIIVITIYCLYFFNCLPNTKQESNPIYTKHKIKQLFIQFSTILSIPYSIPNPNHGSSTGFGFHAEEEHATFCFLQLLPSEGYGHVR